ALLRWRAETADATGFLDLAACFDQAEHIAAYALTYVYAKTEQEVVLLTGSDDGLRLWLNGQMIHEFPQNRSPRPDQDRVLATLRAGWNTVLAKVVNDTGRHGLFLRISAEPADLAWAFAAKNQWDKAQPYFDRLIEAERGKPGEPALRIQRGFV